MNDKLIGNIRPILFVITIVLSLWFTMGFIVPIFIFKDLKESGSFGDSFGAVNALFSGLGFAGLSFTILYQIQTGNESRKLAKFNLYINLIDDVKNDLSSFKLGSLTGLMVWTHLEAVITSLEIDLYKSNKPVFTFLTNIYTQQSHILHLINNDKLIDKEEMKLLNTKIISMYLTYLGNLHLETMSANPSFSNDAFDTYKKTSEVLFDEIDRVTTTF